MPGVGQVADGSAPCLPLTLQGLALDTGLGPPWCFYLKAGVSLASGHPCSLVCGQV